MEHTSCEHGVKSLSHRVYDKQWEQHYGDNILKLYAAHADACERYENENLVRVFVFVNTELGMESQALQKLRKMRGVIEAYMLNGVHDIVALVEVDSVDLMKEVVTETIRRIEGVRSTLSMIVVEGKG